MSQDLGVGRIVRTAAAAQPEPAADLRQRSLRRRRRLLAVTHEAQDLRSRGLAGMDVVARLRGGRCGARLGPHGDPARALGMAAFVRRDAVPRPVVVAARRPVGRQDCGGANRGHQFPRGAGRIDHHELAVVADRLQLLVGLDQHAIGRQRRVGPRPVELGDEHALEQAPRVHALKAARRVVGDRVDEPVGLLDAFCFDGVVGDAVHAEIPCAGPARGPVAASVIAAEGRDQALVAAVVAGDPTDPDGWSPAWGGGGGAPPPPRARATAPQWRVGGSCQIEPRGGGGGRGPPPAPVTR